MSVKSEVGWPAREARGVRYVPFLEDWLPKTLVNCFDTTPTIKRAHRVGKITMERPSSPRTIVMKVLNFKDREKALRAARALRDIRHGDKQVSLFLDLSVETYERQRFFDRVKGQFKSMNIRYGMLYPAHLLVTCEDRRRIFKSVLEAEKYIREPEATRLMKNTTVC